MSMAAFRKVALLHSHPRIALTHEYHIADLVELCGLAAFIRDRVDDVWIPVTPNDPGTALNLATWRALASFDRPFLTLFGDSDPSTAGWDAIFRERVPGAKDQPPATISDAGHLRWGSNG